MTLDHLTFSQQVIMGLIHGGVPTITISIIGAMLLRGQKRHAEQLNGSLEERIRRAVKEALGKIDG